MYLRIMEIHPWSIRSTKLEKEHKRLQESLTSLGNGYMGMRGNFEETYTGDSHLGTYIGGVWFPPVHPLWHPVPHQQIPLRRAKRTGAHPLGHHRHRRQNPQSTHRRRH